MKNIKKYHTYAILILLAIFLLTACSKETGLIITDTSIKMSNGDFSGTETHTVSLAAQTIVKIDMNFKSGDLHISITDEYGNIAASVEGTGVEARRRMSYTMNEDSEYTIKIDGDFYQGSFKISW